MASSSPSGRSPGTLVPFTERGTMPSSLLPVPLTPLLGRDEEIARIRAVLDSGETRLVTLTGPGGIGKTRLALKVAAEVKDDFAHGVCFVPLASIHDAGLVAPAIARTLGVRESKDRPVTQILTEFLRERHLLLVLDNLEQVIAAAPWMSGLLGACPRLKILATSRTPLRVRGEQRLPIPPLPVPGHVGRQPVGTLSAYASVTLFVQRAHAVQPAFELTEANADAVAEICRRLDGLPLAIELAAARVSILSPAALLARLTDRLVLLTGGPRDALPRLQTMRNAVAWSYDLLSPGERALFRRLAVFAGGFTLDAVETVANIKDRILDDVEALVDHSLLTHVPAENGTPRFGMLETIREYALDRLVAGGEEEAARDAHAAYFLDVASESERAMKGSGQVAWLDRLEIEHDNLRAVFSWLDKRDRIEEAMTLAGAIWFFRWIRGYYTEGRTQFETLLAHPDAQGRTIPRASALNGLGITALSQGDHARSLESHNEALTIFKEHGDRENQALALLCTGATLMARGDLDHAEAVSAQSLSLARSLDDPWGISAALGNLGAIELSRNELEQGSALINESIAFGRRAGDRWIVSLNLANLAGMAVNRGNHEQATALAEESNGLVRELGDKRDLPNGSLLLGEIAQKQDDFAGAARHYQEALAVSRETGDKRLIAYSLMSL
ncbi:MAG: AAA family ATPase, partial [Chloroflexia bacterium]|nr:AAA family ATPase [Chloroflexia bacterium]